MKFITDLHIHSRFSRATAKNLNFENLYYNAQIKGIRVVGTGDFTHPAWIAEIESKLEEKEPGLFALKQEIAAEIDKTIPEKCSNPVRFMLQTEISNIYKKDGRVRKNHNLVYFPDIDSVKRFNARLDAIGNIKSDGRPILGLDAADLLEIMLEVNESGFFVPAHIWTPWFSMFGSKSGFDSIEECFGSLKHHIFAVETGLSSDPPMNWRVKDLDHVRLMSNSDAHSPGFLGRNASVFDTEPSFYNIRQALESNDPEQYKGTLDMYPHQGKYHYDGHRKCNICLNPEDANEIQGICPVCGKNLTKGVLSRVQELASRPEGYIPENRHGYRNIIPLADILSEIFKVGPKTKKVSKFYQKAVETLGPELEILLDKPLEEIDASGIALLSTAIQKMRTGDVTIAPGYDGEYGKVKLFSEEERNRLENQKSLFNTGTDKSLRATAKPMTKNKIRTCINQVCVPEPESCRKPRSPETTSNSRSLLSGLNPEQRQAVESPARAIIIQAGPGTGKTRTLSARIAFLVSEKNIDPGSILALTFTNKAALQLENRTGPHLPETGTKILAATFHAFCLKLLKKYKGFTGSVADDQTRLALIEQAMKGKKGKNTIKKTDILISLCRQGLVEYTDDISKIIPPVDCEWFRTVYQNYCTLCLDHNIIDFDGLIMTAVKMISQDRKILSDIRQKYSHIFIDEYQDLNLGQYELTRLLSEGNHIFVIGDPDQSIYGFRGSDNKYFKCFEKDFPGCEKIIFSKNYRSVQPILDASFQMIAKARDNEEKTKIFSDMKTGHRIIIRETAGEKAEATAIGLMIEKLMGGTSFFSMDAGKADQNGIKEYSFSDFAVLYRTKKQSKAFIEVFEHQNLPFQTADREKWTDQEETAGLISILRAIAGFDTRPEIPGIQVVDLRHKVLNLSAQKTIDLVLRESGLSESAHDNIKLMQNFKDLIEMAEPYNDIKDFLNSLALNQDRDVLNLNTEKISLMTIHAAKGLEFPVVFIAGCEQGLIPFAKDGMNVDDPEEERRLFYVAMTRAKDILCLTHAKKRIIFGKPVRQNRSPFIDDIEKQLLMVKKAKTGSRPVKKARQLELF
jgi:DNA helicase-2/ATP-dependent DNA helicase PcrA